MKLKLYLFIAALLSLSVFATIAKAQYVGRPTAASIQSGTTGTGVIVQTGTGGAFSSAAFHPASDFVSAGVAPLVLDITFSGGGGAQTFPSDGSVPLIYDTVRTDTFSAYNTSTGGVTLTAGTYLISVLDLINGDGSYPYFIGVIAFRTVWYQPATSLGMYIPFPAAGNGSYLNSSLSIITIASTGTWYFFVSCSNPSTAACTSYMSDYNPTDVESCHSIQIYKLK